MISDFGPSFVIVCMSLLAAQPFVSNSVFIGEGGEKVSESVREWRRKQNNK